MRVVDASMTKTLTLPAAAGTTNSASVELGPLGPGAIGGNFEVHVKTPALAALADTKNIVYKIQQSADDSTWTDLFTLHEAGVVGVSTDGSAAKDYRFYLPPATKKYIRLSATADATSGDVTGSAATLEFCG